MAPVSASLNQQLKGWFQTNVEWMERSEQGRLAREYGNNLTAWYHVLVSVILHPACELFAPLHPTVQCLHILFGMRSVVLNE